MKTEARDRRDARAEESVKVADCVELAHALVANSARVEELDELVAAAGGDARQVRV